MAASRDPGAPRALIWPAVVVALLFAVMIGAALLQGRPVFDPPDLAFESDREPNPLPSVTAPPPAFGLEPDTSSPRGLELPVDLLNAIALAVLAAGVAVILVLVARRLLRNRPHRARAAAVLDDIAAGATEQVDAPTVRRGIDGAIARFAETPRHADAIVSAWIGLEETAADAGRARGAAETPGEFTTRILGERPAAAADLTRLLGIYERVRFGGHEADAAEREAARDALVRIREAWT